jgi:hypothetical protein
MSFSPTTFPVALGLSLIKIWDRAVTFFFFPGLLMGRRMDMKFWISSILTFFLTLFAGTAAGTAQLQTVQAAPEQAASQTIVTFETGRQPTTEIHVAMTGNDTTGNGSPGNPYRTIGRGIQEAVPGAAIRTGSTWMPFMTRSAVSSSRAASSPPGATT